MHSEELYRQMLGLMAPWDVERVDVYVIVSDTLPEHLYSIDTLIPGEDDEVMHLTPTPAAPKTMLIEATSLSA